MNEPIRRKIKELEVMVAEVIYETPDTRTLVFFTGNDPLEYKPGHFLTIAPQQFPALERWTTYLEHLKGKKEPSRAYSMSSCPQEKYLAITVKEERYIPGMTPYPPLLSPILALRTAQGTRMVITGFTGPYTMPDDIESKTDHVLHVCAGSGVVPSYSIIKDSLMSGRKLRHTLVYSNKSWEDTIFAGQLLDLQKQYVFACGPSISVFEKKAAKEKGVEPPPRFLESVLQYLGERGFPQDRIKRESYG